jgi:hypothetical protein
MASGIGIFKPGLWPLGSVYGGLTKERSGERAYAYEGCAAGEVHELSHAV